MQRLTQYIGQVIRLVVILIGLAAIIFTVQTLWHVFDPVIAYVNQDVDAVNSTLSATLVAGVSIGALVVFLMFLFIPLLSRGVNNRQFLVSFARGVLASVVFFVSDFLYGYFERLGRIYLVLAIITAIVITVVLIEIFTKAAKKQNEVSIRTDLMASISSGLAFGLILKIGTYGWEYLRTIFKI